MGDFDWDLLNGTTNANTNNDADEYDADGNVIVSDTDPTQVDDGTDVASGMPEITQATVADTSTTTTPAPSPNRPPTKSPIAKLVMTKEQAIV